jgi:hypothetical protein
MGAAVRRSNSVLVEDPLTPPQRIILSAKPDFGEFGQGSLSRIFFLSSACLRGYTTIAPSTGL